MPRLGVPDLLSCQGVPVGQPLPMDLGVPEKGQTKQSLLHLNCVHICKDCRVTDFSGSFSIIIIIF